MTPLDEGKLLHREVLKLRPDKRRRYPEDLRRRILSWVDRATDAGAQERDCAKTIGVKTWRFTVWRRWDARVAAEEAQAREAQARQEAPTAPLALVPIEMPTFSVPTGTTIVTPSGYRVEGLSLDQVVVLLRELA